MQAIVLVIDSFGIGALPDAANYGDAGAHTAGHICEAVPGPKWPELAALGLGNAGSLTGHAMPGCAAVDTPQGFWGIMAQKSPGKDTTAGHWELAGLELNKPFHLFPPEYPSFPPEFVDEFCRQTGRGLLGNCAASGPQIINKLGVEHLESGSLICYTSADSVFQIAAHEDHVPLDELYKACEIARRLLDPYNVGRVIARPFNGSPGDFTRTKNRRDFSIALPGPGLLDHLLCWGVETIGVGKIGDIFNGSGLVQNHSDKGNPACLERCAALLSEQSDVPRFIFVNLVDTDMIYGHRRDPAGYAAAVNQISSRLPEFMDLLDDGDLLVITADHGCDPLHPGTDHTREYVPLLAWLKGGILPVAPPEEDPDSCRTPPGFLPEGPRRVACALKPKAVGIRSSFADMAASICQYFDVPPMAHGRSIFTASSFAIQAFMP